MSRTNVTLAIVFADICGSTDLYEKLGDAAARARVSACLDMMTAATDSNGGTVIKTIGDEIMSTFPSADKAVAAAMDMQEGVLPDRSEECASATPPTAIRSGLHYGPAILEAGDVFGDAVNVAARMAGLAKAGQIITTRATAEMLSPMLRQSTRHLDRVPVKGKAGEIDIYEVIWQVGDTTKMAANLLDTQERTARLLLSYRGHSVDLDADAGGLILGRGTNANLVVNGSMASRLHARVECRRGKFVLIDMSTNGTYVQTGEGHSYLRREEIVLTGEGKIALGRDFDEATEIVTFVATV